MASATFFWGSSVSAAAIVTSSVPPKAKTTTSRAEATPVRPLGMKPPCSVRLDSPGLGTSSAPISSSTPTTRNPTTAATLSSANQNSASPSVPTRTRLITVNTAMKISAHAHCGREGHISVTSCAAAVASAATTTTICAHHSQPSARPMVGPSALPAYVENAPEEGSAAAISPRARITSTSSVHATR